MKYVLVATGTNTTLQFGFRDDPSYIFFDDVSVVPLIQPAITGINVGTTNIVLNAVNGQWNGTYLTLMGTNLVQPVSQWTPVATNMLDGSGNFSINVVNGVNFAAPQQFYKLWLQ